MYLRNVPLTWQEETNKLKQVGPGRSSASHRQPGHPLKLDELEDRRGAGHQIFLRQLQSLRRCHVVCVAETHAVPVQVQLYRQGSRVFRSERCVGSTEKEVRRKKGRWGLVPRQWKTW